MSLGIVAGMVLLLTPFAVSAPATDTLIVPGDRIGQWTLDMTVGDLVRLNGQPFGPLLGTGTVGVVPGLSSYGWYMGANLQAMSRDGTTVVLLRVNGGEFKTEKGIGFLTLMAGAERAYGSPTARTNPTLPVKRLIYDALGIAFESVAFIDEVHAIYVFRPGSARSLWRY